jgi:glycosyltransferase involved in cell wall biosynthesis
MLVDFYENCDAVIALNRSAAADIAQFGYRGRLFIIPNGRDLNRFGACEIPDVTSPTRVLTFVGFVNQRKNQHYLIESLGFLPRTYVLQIIGQVMDADYGRQIEDRVRENGLDNVVLTGPVDYGEIPGYLAKTHVFVSASKMEDGSAEPGCHRGPCLGHARGGIIERDSRRTGR